MTWSNDPSIAGTYRSDDDERFDREQDSKHSDRASARKAVERSSSGTRVTVKAEVRCGRCRHWRFPSRVKQARHVPVNPFGDCRAVAVITERKGDYEKGQVVTQEHIDGVIAARLLFPAQFEDLRTTGSYDCPTFQAIVDWRKDPDADVPDEVRDAWEGRAA